MQKLQELLDFCERNGNLGNREIVEIIIYYLTIIQGNEFCIVSDVRAAFVSINHPAPTRTAQYLSEGTQQQRQQYVKKRKGYALHRRNLARLNVEFSDIVKGNKPKIKKGILDVDTCTGQRRYLVSMVEQINGTYEYGFYDASAVLMRRILEILIISTFQAKSLESLIADDDGNYFPLNALINQAKNKTNINLSRGMTNIMDLVKDLGDTAAHNRTYITKKEDIDIVQNKFRRLIEELCVLSGITQP